MTAEQVLHTYSGRQEAETRLARAQEAIYALHASDGQDHPWCTGCTDPWPCATVDAFDRALQ